ncbi:MAG: NUDIX hydrolase [Proteobacteria bacterium]|nr:NUDIX hydrolase [Pseudomonadota bacterium]
MIDFTETRLSGDAVFEGRLLAVHRDRVRLPDGRESVREYMVHRNAAVAIPLLDEQIVLMVRQYRYAIGQHTLEFPAGKIDDGESPAQAASRELREETGYLSDDLQTLFQLRLPVAYATATASIFLARKLRFVGHIGEPGEFVEPIALTIAEALQKIGTGEICDMKDVVGLLALTGRTDFSRRGPAGR